MTQVEHNAVVDEMITSSISASILLWCKRSPPDETSLRCHSVAQQNVLELIPIPRRTVLFPVSMQRHFAAPSKHVAAAMLRGPLACSAPDSRFRRQYPKRPHFFVGRRAVIVSQTVRHVPTMLCG
jgi:hypothetical protein